ncbi:MAG: lytic transglycosylase domain-containing protein, partial [Pseudolabrys sp.]
VRRVIKRESGGNARVVSAGNYGLMQIKLATARSMGYTGNAAGLLDANTNMTYAVKYLAGAYRLANGNHSRAVHYYAAGYYYAAKARGASVTSLAQATDAFTAAAPSRSMKFSSRQNLREAYRQTDGFGSSSNFYNTRPDY